MCNRTFNFKTKSMGNPIADPIKVEALQAEKIVILRKLDDVIFGANKRIEKVTKTANEAYTKPQEYNAATLVAQTRLDARTKGYNDLVTRVNAAKIAAQAAADKGVTDIAALNLKIVELDAQILLYGPTA